MKENIILKIINTNSKGFSFLKDKSNSPLVLELPCDLESVEFPNHRFCISSSLQRANSIGRNTSEGSPPTRLMTRKQISAIECTEYFISRWKKRKSSEPFQFF